MPELAGDDLAWKADCLLEPSRNFTEREEGPPLPMDPPILSFDMPTS